MHRAEDLDDYCAMEADPEVRRYAGGQPRPHSEAEARFRAGIEQPPQDWLRLWATIDRQAGRYIGRCGVYPHFDDAGIPIPREGSLSIYLARDCWGHGLATEAGLAFIEFGFTRLDLDTIFATVQVGNSASTRVMQKIGMRLIRVEHAATRSFEIYRIARGEWAAAHEPEPAAPLQAHLL